jgi:hypothetical protein
VHRIAPTCETIAHQFLFCVLSFSKAAAATVAVSQLAVMEMSGPLAALIPLASASFGVFATFFVMNRHFTSVWPFCIAILLKLWPWTISYFPINREEMMRGTLLNEVTVWCDMFGYVVVGVVLVLGIRLPNRHVLPNLFSGLVPLAVLHFFREGTKFQTCNLPLQ